MASVTLEKACKTFPGSVIALDEISLSVEDGEFLVLLGPSGCGKSTTLRCIAGLEELDHGTIKIGKRIVNDLEPKDRHVSMVFQNHALYPNMTVRQNISFGMKLRKVPKGLIKKKVEWASQTVQLDGLLDRTPDALSGGQKQRVALARALVREPDVFLFDEPLSQLDATLRTELRREIAMLHQKLQTTTIFVTHDQLEAMTLATKICIMNKGRLQQTGSPREIYDQPVNLFVAGFIGSPPMNIFPGKVKIENGRQLFDAGALQLDLSFMNGLRNQETIYLGLRPEQIQLVHHPDPSSLNFEMESKQIESTGHEQRVYGCIGQHPVALRLNNESTPVVPSKHIASFKAEHLHVFDQNENRLTVDIQNS